MNRRKKGNQILKARAKKAKAKLSGKKKCTYVSKAEREKIAQASALLQDTQPEQHESEQEQ